MARRLLLAAACAALVAPVLPASAGEDGDGPVDTADLVRKVHDGFAAFDADGDGKIAAGEFPLEDLFGRIDGDGDGFLTREEVGRALKASAGDGAPPAKAPGGKVRKAPPAAPKDDAADGESFADRAKRRVAVDPRFNAENRRAQFLAGFDRDPKDGRIQRKEYAAGDADRVFREFDADKDGALDDRELLALMRDQIHELGKQRKHPNRYNFLVLFDLDDDRTVTREEYAFLRGPASTFTGLDDDGDGVVTYDEILYDRERNERRYRGKGAGRGEAEPAASRTLWDLYDKDRDGRVTAEEFGGGEAVFRRLDRNRDGVLTLADA